MNKVYIAVGIVAVVVLGTAALSSYRSGSVASEDANLAASAAAGAQAQSVVVVYTDKGFSPSVVKVPRGASIDFLNQSNKALRIAPLKVANNDESAYLGFEATRSTKRNETFGVSVTKPGLWGYKNLNVPTDVGVVIVE